jgi:hypothetical protein
MLQYSVRPTVAGFREHYNIYLGDIITQTPVDHGVACPDLNRQPGLVSPSNSAVFLVVTPPDGGSFFK